MQKHFSFAGLAVYEAPEEALRRFARFIVDEELQPGAPLDAAVFEYPPGSRCHEHVHEDAVEIYFILDGQLVSVMDGEEFILNKYDLLYIPKGAVHRLENRGKVPAFFLAVHVPPVEDGAQFRKSWKKFERGER